MDSEWEQLSTKFHLDMWLKASMKKVEIADAEGYIGLIISAWLMLTEGASLRIQSLTYLYVVEIQ